MIRQITDTFVLSNGVKIPCVGYGTWQTPDGDIARESVKTALEAGYRHVDTAFAYGNEVSVGEGIRASGVNRHDIFLTTKHWVTERGYEKTIATAEESLRNLGVDYLDLYLIHWPCVNKISPEWKEINASTWRGFEKLYKDGKIRAIGVSNFMENHLSALEEYAEIMPMVNQIEYHPGYTQLPLVNFCREKNILVEAWSPLGCGRVLSDETVVNLAKEKGVTSAQLCIRYALDRGVLPLPKSVHADRIVSNMDVFGFTLTEKDYAVLDSMPVTGCSGFFAEEAPADALA